MRCADSHSATLSITAAASPPSCLISSTTRFAANTSSSGIRARSLTITLAPFAANAFANSRPIPAPAPVTTTTLPSTILPMLFSLLPLGHRRSNLFQNMDGAGAAESDDMRQTNARALHLPPACLPTEMRAHLVDIGDAGGSQRVALRQQSTRYIDGNTSTQGRIATVDQRPTLPGPAQPKILVVQDFGCRKAIMQFDQLQILRTQSGHFVRTGCRLPRHGIHVLHHLIALRPGVARQRRRAHPHSP